ncbi:MFS general substrate transporter [Calocera cornea HHB12733]|uniref:MFS general substrate transporter n=1 Tax=Calocera cornea HHB12733 TaxID=1353952 RepID=A0A165DX74_9BASI|nr:MFS general substrate transporter [Calocera cornea HHB12733]
MSLFQETLAGQILHHGSRKRLFPYPEQQPGYVLPPHLLGGQAGDEARLKGHPAWEGPPAANRSLEPPREREGRESDASTLVEPPTGASGDATPPRTAGDGLEEVRLEDGTSDAEKEKIRARESLVDWYGPDDPANPMNWSTGRKVFVTALICLLTFSVYIGSAIYSPGIPDVSQEFGASSTTAALGLTLFVFGYGLGPMFLAPLSEIPSIGRNPPYLATLAIFVALQYPTALATNIHTLLALRFLAGFFGSPSLATGGATLSDMFGPAHRPYAIGIWGLAAVCGPVLGPLVGGFASEKLGWRWTIWPLAFLASATLIILCFTLPETSAHNILVRRARRLRALTGNKGLQSEGEREQASMTGREAVMTSFVRPFTLSIEPIVFFLNLYIALVYAILYTWFESFPLVFVDIYGFTPGTEGLAYLGIFVGAILTYALYCLYVRAYLEPAVLASLRSGRRPEPEDRLPPAFLGAFAIPLCLFWFGWTARADIPWIVPVIGSSFFSVGAFLLFNSVLNYLGDAYSRYAASVLAGNDLFRSYVGGAFPLFAGAMFAHLGVGGGNSLLGGLSIVMIPIPFVLYFYGPRIREWSKYADKDE